MQWCYWRLMVTCSNQTNLAIKGIIALEAVSVMAERLGNQTARANYSSIAHNYLDFWEQQSIVTSADPPHTNLAYNENNTYGECSSFSRLVPV